MFGFEQFDCKYNDSVLYSIFEKKLMKSKTINNAISYYNLCGNCNAIKYGDNKL